MSEATCSPEDSPERDRSGRALGPCGIRRLSLRDLRFHMASHDDVPAFFHTDHGGVRSEASIGISFRSRVGIFLEEFPVGLTEADMDRLHDPVERESCPLGGFREVRCRRGPEEEDRHAVSRDQDASKTAYWFSGLALIPGSSDEGKRVPHLFLGDPGPVALDDKGRHRFAPAG
jgi:hypothetical protein